MKHWPFSVTPREAFHPERAALVDQLVAFLGEHVEDIARLDAQELAERIDELGLDITELMDETLSKKLLGGGALDFFSACLLESKELLLRLVNKPTSKSNKLNVFDSAMDNHPLIMGSLTSDAHDLGLASIAVRLHFQPGIDRYPYLLAVFKFMHPEIDDIDRARAPFEFTYSPMRKASSRHLNWSMLGDFADMSLASAPTLDSPRTRFSSDQEWAVSYKQALDVFQVCLESADEPQRPKLTLDKMLSRLVYDPVMTWLFAQAPLDLVRAKYEPIIGMILDHQGMPSEHKSVYTRHIWITALSASPDALLAENCTLSDLLPLADEHHGLFGGKPLPLFLQGPLGVYWSYESSYVIDHRKNLEQVVGKIDTHALLNSHFMAGEAVTLFLDWSDQDNGQGDDMNIPELLQSSLMNDLTLNPYQSSDGLNRIFQYANILPRPYSREAIERLFLNRLATVVGERRHELNNLYLDLALFVSKQGRPMWLLQSCFGSELLTGPKRSATAKLLVNVFRLDSSHLKALEHGPKIPDSIRDCIFSLDLGL